jgi:hypothetical protein
MLCAMTRVLFDSYGDPIPRGLHDLLAEAGCAPGATVTERRAALEALADASPDRLQELDAPLLRLRLEESADQGLPRVVGGLRRERLLGHDSYSSTWLGWWEQDGQRGAVRCLRSPWTRDPVLLRRLERGVRATTGVRGLAPMQLRPHGEHPHVAYRLDGVPLADLLPAEDTPDLQPMIRWLGTGLETLQALQERGLALLHLTPRQILLGPQRAQLLHMDPLDRDASALCDVSQLVACLLLLDPEGSHPLSPLVEPWVTVAPGTAQEASELLRRALADHLLAARHRVAMRGRSTDRGARAADLYAAARALQAALPPPAGRCVLRAGHDRVLSLVESDGSTVRGGAAAGVPPFGMLPLYTPRKGLDAPSTRALLRAWAKRDDGDEELRTAAQQRWEGSDEAGEALVRWLGAASRLRRAQLVLAHRLRR